MRAPRGSGFGSAGLIVLIVIVGAVLWVLALSIMEVTTKRNYTSDQPSDVSLPAQSPVSFKGVGQRATDTFFLRQGLVVFEMDHYGNRNYAIWLMDTNGKRIELLVNEIGNFDGSKAVRIPQSGMYILDVKADGSWSIKTR